MEEESKSFLDKAKETMSNVVDKSKAVVSNVMDKGNETFTTDTGKPNVLLIVSLFLVMLVIYLVMYFYRQSKYSPYLIQKVTPVTKRGDILVPATYIPSSSYSQEFSYSMWIYISDDTFHHEAPGTEKKYVILTRSNSNKTYMVFAIDSKRKLYIRFNQSGADSANTGSNLLDKAPQGKADVDNIPFNTFVHLAVVVYNMTIVVYINGVLVKTTRMTNQLDILKTTDTINNNFKGDDNVLMPSFKGWISKLRYFVDINKENGGALTDKQVYDLYLNSPYPSLFEKIIQSISEKIMAFDDSGKEEKGAGPTNIGAYISGFKDRISQLQLNVDKAASDLKTEKKNKADIQDVMGAIGTA